MHNSHENVNGALLLKISEQLEQQNERIEQIEAEKAKPELTPRQKRTEAIKNFMVKNS